VSRPPRRANCAMDAYEEIYAVVRRIPPGMVSSYGRVALIAGRPGAARLVGYALHALRQSAGDEVPWWRVVNRNGFISNSYQPALQRAMLMAEGVAVDERDVVDLRRHLWEGDAPGG
jgi:methylated-DNA-protein-cysteine methyltransferase-like protein